MRESSWQQLWAACPRNASTGYQGGRLCISTLPKWSAWAQGSRCFHRATGVLPAQSNYKANIAKSIDGSMDLKLLDEFLYRAITLVQGGKLPPGGLGPQTSH